jgi:hypothetical protein
MASVRRSLVVVGTILAVALALGVPSVGASSAKAFHIAKDCDGLTCVITTSNYRGIPVGTVINYTENTDGSLTAVIAGPHGTATGRCDLAPIFTTGDPGSCVFASGTGALTQFHLDVAVTVTSADFVSWAWDGSYWFGASN